MDRPNRFLTRVEVDGKVVSSHLPDPGRLAELLVPGAEVYLRPRNSDSNLRQKTARKDSPTTTFTTVLVKNKQVLVSLVSVLPNRLVAESLRENSLFPFRDYRLVRSEVVHGRHRFDFLLEDPAGRPFYLEVKSVTYVEGKIAQFPDAVTTRGKRHVQALQDIVTAGGQAGVLFVCQRPDASAFQPMWDRDPEFSRALWDAWQAGVQVCCFTTQVTAREMTFLKAIPVNLAPPVPGSKALDEGS